MSTIKYSDLLDEVLPFLAADPSDPVTEAAIRRSVIEFFSRSWLWKYLPDPVDLVAGEPVYDLEPPQGGSVVAVMNVIVNGQPIDNKTIEWLDRNVPLWRTERRASSYFTQVQSDQVILAPVPDTNVTGGITMTLAIAPSATSKSFPAWVVNNVNYLETIVDGALYRLMLMPNKPWTDLKNGADRRLQFNTGVASASELAATALSRAPTRVSSNH